MIPAAGSAYTYSYAVFGELIAWIVGWSLILEYTLVVSAVAVGWAGYGNDWLTHNGLALPGFLTHGPVLGARQCGGPAQQASFGINILAVLIIGIVAGLLNFGTRESARVNTTLVIVKLATLSLFVIVALPIFQHGELASFHAASASSSTPGPCARKYGVMPAAAIIFFAFYGFDAISTAAEEAKSPERDLAIGIVGSMIVCVLIYMVVAAAAIGAVALHQFAKSPEPLALILRESGQQGRIATIVSSRRRDRAADGHPRFLLRAEPDLPRHGPRRLLPEELRVDLEAPRNAGADHDLHRDRRRGHRRVTPIDVDRRARQRRHIVRIHRGLRGHAGAAAAASRTRERPFRTPAGVARRPRGRSSGASICSPACRG